MENLRPLRAGSLHLLAGHGALFRLRAVILCAGFLTAFITPLARALDPDRPLAHYLRQAWDIRSGLPNENVWCLLQTRDGYIWAGTDGGLARFDGVRFVNYTSGNTPALKSNAIRDLFEDREGTLWIGTAEGYVLMRHHVFAPFEAKGGPASENITSVRQGPDESFWVGTSSGLYRLKLGVFTSFAGEGGPGENSVRVLLVDAHGGVWVVASGGAVYRLFQGRFSQYPTSGLRVFGLRMDAEGRVWINTYQGLHRFDNGRQTAFTREDGLPDDIVYALRIDRHDCVWLGTMGGLCRYHDGTFERLNTLDGRASVIANSILEDREGNLWLGTLTGLQVLREPKVTTYGMAQGLPTDQLAAIAEDRDGALWVGGMAGLSRLQGGKTWTYTVKDGLPSDKVYTLGKSATGGLWLGTVNGICRTDSAGSFHRILESALVGVTVLAILEDSRGELWVGTRGTGLVRLHDGAVSIYTTKDGLPDNYVNYLLDAGDGTVWVGTGGGLTQVREGRFSDPLLQEHRVESLCRDPGGTLWVGTTDAGLWRLKGGRLTAFGERTGIPCRRVHQILGDESGNLWLSTDMGILCVSTKELERVARGEAQAVSCLQIGSAEGMHSISGIPALQSNACRTSDGKLWFGTQGGLVMIDPRTVKRNNVPPPVLVEDIVVDDKSIGASSGMSIAPGWKRLELQYTAPSFLAPEKLKFKYWLEGFDKDWVDAGTKRAAHFMNLSPGRYTFRVKGCNSDGVWNEAGASLVFTLRPFFYQTRAFQILCALALMAMGAGAQRLRIRRLKVRAKELEEIVKERTSELRRVQEQLARISEATPEKLENISGWGASMAGEIARAIEAREIGIWRAEGESLVALSSGATKQPSWDAVLAARARLEDGSLSSTSGETVIPVTGMTGELRGALVIEGPVNWGEVERRLVTGFVQHLGSALDLQHLRGQLTLTQARQAATRQKMIERGVRTLQLCPRCGRCYDDSAEKCAADGSHLDSSRLLPYSLLGRYRLTSLLGEGGMGSVFSALDEKLSRDVALKVIKAELLQNPAVRFRIEREARMLAQVHHPSVISLFDSGELDDGSAFLVMELLSGRDLAGLLRRCGPGSPRQVALLLRHAGAGLGAAHRAGVIHRDIKPANIFLVPDKRGFLTKVLDFGLAKSVDADARLTQTGMRVGTPAYMSPEQVRGLEADARSDLYSLASVGYEALTGHRVMKGDGVGNLLLNVLHTRPQPISSVVPGFASGVDKAFEAALAKEPSSRPADIEAWTDELAGLLDSTPHLHGHARAWPLDALQARRPESSPATEPAGDIRSTDSEPTASES